MFTKRTTTTLVLIPAAVVPTGLSSGEISWSDTPSFTLDMLCQDPSDTGLVWEDSLLFTLDMLCYDPSVTGMTLEDGNVFLLQFADLDWDGNVDLADFVTFATCFGGSGVPVSPECECSDFDGDDDVDLTDFVIFAANFTG